jgi:indolepyruvate ferredoxin oxidoreductase, alpha subunit
MVLKRVKGSGSMVQADLPQLLLGDEAVAAGAIDAGIGGVFGYPGTPSTEIFEYVQNRATRLGIAARWSGNEKVAYEAALGMSYTGKRALVTMKHVGLNVAADPFMSSTLTGANGGLVVAVGDDPGMHSSQNEQDTRFYARFGQIPLLEPAAPQEAYDMARQAFEISEHFGTPVLLRLVTRLAHCRAQVATRPASDPPLRPSSGAADEWILLPPNARKRFQRLLDLQPAMTRFSDDSPFNQLRLQGPRGVILAGVAWNYFCEAAGEAHDYSTLKIGTYPPPDRLLRELVDHCPEILVIEEGYPLVERDLVGMFGVPGRTVRGKLSGAVPMQGELTVEVARAALGMRAASPHPAPQPLPERPPQLCTGCPHCDSYNAIVDAVGEGRPHYYFSDIGCYTLAALPPYNAIDTCVEMGASIGMAIGAARAGAHPVVATIGDSTFTHSGMTSLLEAAHDDLNMTVVILDNALVAMTGGQEVYVTGDDLARIILGLGVNPQHLVRIQPLARSHAEQVALIRQEIEHPGLSVILASRPCIHARRRTAEAPAVTISTQRANVASAPAETRGAVPR